MIFIPSSSPKNCSHTECTFLFDSSLNVIACAIIQFLTLFLNSILLYIKIIIYSCKLLVDIWLVSHSCLFFIKLLYTIVFLAFSSSIIYLSNFLSLALGLFLIFSCRNISITIIFVNV